MRFLFVCTYMTSSSSVFRNSQTSRCVLCFTTAGKESHFILTPLHPKSAYSLTLSWYFIHDSMSFQFV
jgi:hypothetical protein